MKLSQVLFTCPHFSLNGSDAYCTEVIVLAAEPDINTAVECIKSGAFDYLTKPFKLSDIVGRINEAYNRNKEKRQVLDFRHISSIYKSSHIYSKTLHQDKIFSYLLKTVQNEFKVSGVYIKIFKREFVNKSNLNFNIIKYIDNIFCYSKSREIFQNKKAVMGSYKSNSDTHYLALPMFNSGGLWGVFIFFRRGERKFDEAEIKILYIHDNQY